MQMALAYSLSRLIEDEIGFPALIIYDGIKLPSEKPFATIRQLANVSTGISKGREAVSTNYGFRISLFCETSAQRMEVQERLRDVFLFEENIPLFNSGTFSPSGRTFSVTVDGEVPLEQEDISDETRTHQLHFDISIENIRHKNRGSIAK